MKTLHECPRNIPGYGMKVYTYDKTKEKTWYINALIVFYCPYCGVDLKGIEATEQPSDSGSRISELEAFGQSCPSGSCEN